VKKYRMKYQKIDNEFGGIVRATFDTPINLTQGQVIRFGTDSLGEYAYVCDAPKEPKPDRAVLKVSLDVPDGATRDNVVGYIEAAVRVHNGGLDPEDPMSRLDRSSVDVNLTNYIKGD
jgi:hypothetical protein